MPYLAPNYVKELVQKFETHKDSYKSPSYNETQLRREFLDPLFTALGWDMVNKEGKPEAYKDVIHEDAIRIGEMTKAPDYCFRIGGARKYFLEAKKPFINLHNDPSPAYQVRRYSWSAKLPVGILSDFEELVIYDSRLRPYPGDKANKHRIRYYNYQDFISKWEEIFELISKTAVENGSLEKLVGETRAKGETVDKEFLKEMEGWREILAKNLASQNPNISVRNLNHVVQTIINRIVFLRISEDRDIEPYQQLFTALNYSAIWPRVDQLFQRADERYNSGLFNRKDAAINNVAVGDSALKEIISNLYPPNSPYAFSVIPAEILGHVYEQFLGKVIRLTSGHRAVVEEKPEVRKAGGIYYTPEYIVDYIVKQTVGKLLENKTPKEVSKLKILDPACGSGSFLLGAYQTLIDWHRDWYTAHSPEKYTKGKQPQIYKAGVNDWRLSTIEKKRILLNNIFGVDIDQQAVEVAKLSLLLKVMEGENSETINRQLTFWRERALPDLSSNIKCGNSLVGTDYYANIQLDLLDTEEKIKVNAFNWKEEFTEIMDSGGFDTVVGNPPYNALLTTEEKSYLKQHYESVKKGRQDTAAIFVEKALSLSKDNVMYLLPYRLISRRRNHGPFQKWLYENTSIEKVIYIGKISEIKASDEFMIVKALKHRKINNSIYICNRSTKVDFTGNKLIFKSILQVMWGPPEYVMSIRLGDFDPNILSKIRERSTQLGDICESKDGIVPFIREKLVSEEKKDNRYKPLLGIRGRYFLDRYSLRWGGTYICYDFNEARKWIKDSIELRKVQLRDEAIFLNTEKILTSQDSTVIKGTIDTSKFYTTNSIHTTYLKPNVKYNLKYVLGHMNSKLVNYYYQSIVLKGQDLHPQILVTDLPKLPIYEIDFATKQSIKIHKALTELVSKILDLNRLEAKSSGQQEKEVIRREIEGTDKQIDDFIYTLYGLTEKEIKIVEERTK